MFFVEKDFESWDPKIHGPHNYLKIFYVAAIIEEFGNEKHYPLAMFLNGISKNTRSSYKGTMNDGTPSSSSRSKMASKKNKNRCSTFKIKIKMHCYYLKIDDDALFKNGSKRPAFVLRPLKSVLNFEVDILSLQQLEYEMDCADLPDDYIFFEIGYCGNPDFPYAHIQLEQSTKLIFSHFQEEDHSFIHDTHTKRHNWFTSIWSTDRRKTYPERI